MAEAGTTYRVSGKLGQDGTDGLVITCSDGRFRRPVEHFLYNQLGLGNYDLIAVPGSVYMLSFADVLPKQLKLGLRMVKFLVKSHLPDRIVLIAHQDCGRYREGFASWLNRSEFSLEEKQRRDLKEVRQQLNEMFPSLQVDAFYARAEDSDSVQFDLV